MSVEIVAELKELKLNGMASCYPELLAKARHSELAPDAFMKQLIEAETAQPNGTLHGVSDGGCPLSDASGSGWL